MAYARGYTQAQLDAQNAAILTYAAQMAIQVDIGDKMIRYSDSKLNDMISLRNAMEIALGHVQARTYARNGGRSS